MFLNRHSDYHILVVLVAENCLESAVLQQIDITIGSNTVGLSAKGCGLRKPCFEPEKGFRREFRGANGIGNGDFEPGSEILKGCGLRKQSFEPEKAVRRGPRGANGIGNGDFEPGSEILKGCGLRKQSFEPG